MFKLDELCEINEPIVLKNVLCNAQEFSNWKLLNWSLEDLANKSGDLKLPFRVGKNIKTINPQWEVETPIEYKTIKEFLKDVTEPNDLSKWYYFDYKHINQWFQEKPEILKSFDWQQFKLELDGTDSTIWIGSKGAHTNCHRDTYGCNLIAQIHGRKLWLLFSPECSNSMQPTRIPYEESTIYSKYNFFTPNELVIEAISNLSGSVKMIILEPKDVLFVPKGWWHYVESLDTSLSVNVWLPVKEDCITRLQETLVHLVMNTMGNSIPKTINQLESNFSESIQFVKTSLKECQELKKCTLESLQKRQKLNLITTDFLDYLKIKYANYIKILPDLTSENINDFITKNNITKIDDINLKDNIVETNDFSNSFISEAVIDAFCHPSVILKISQILVKKLENNL
ncbi:PREDICTED: HSPB1-associated protein 1 homolog [Ceratosolen solmsi marchali]|uniref:HSPB1-associated protein 1 homolog n=1 Tax=Ceratosolen solmsi marchali TaxID=326594 RepID=A0AAJ6YDZ8_9HYME|nr:PREDICTED: HSPB1-associated protein 1 homolog [Ceratosolen solmsi marchali]